jgi:hypothetical protein
MKCMGVLLFAGLIFLSPNAMGAVSDEDLEALRAELAALNAKFEQLARENAELKQANEDTATAVSEVQETGAEEKSSWSDRVGIKGDFRYRYQNDAVGIPGTADRNRNRIRARAAIVADLPSNVEVGFGLATGGDDPVSSNLTLGNAGSSKDVKLDLAYFDWNATEGTNIRGGKVKNTFERAGKSELQWDADWRPEGFDAAWDNDRIFAQGLGTYLEGDSANGTNFAYLLQAGARGKLGPVELMGGLGYTDIDAKGEDCFFQTSATPFLCQGNSADANGRYLFDFQTIDVFAELGFDAGPFPFTIFGEYIDNRDAPSSTGVGYRAGAQLGKAKKKNTWQVKYWYQDLNPDATLGLLTWSDFGGGGTDSKGSVISGAYALTDQANIKLTYILAERLDTSGTLNGGTPYDLDTLQLDLNFKYK